MARKLCGIIFFLLFCNCHVIHAQDSFLSIAPEYSVPQGRMNWSYKPGVGVRLTYGKTPSTRRSQGISLSYISFKPNADTVYYVSDYGLQNVIVGKAAFSAMQCFQLSGHYDFIIPFNKTLSLIAGGALTITYNKRTVYFKDQGMESTTEETIPWVGVSPKLGLEYNISNQLSLSPYASYMFMFQAGSTNQGSVYYNENTGHLYFYLSTGLSLNFYF